MKTNRLVVRLYSVVAILAVLIYLSGVAMADPTNKNRKHDDFDAVPDYDSFSESGSDTFSETPTPTFTPEPPRPQKKEDDGKPPKEKKDKDKKGDDDEVWLLNSGTINLKVIGMTVTPSGSSAGDSGLPGQAATLTIVVRNLGNATAENFPLDVWFSRPTAPAFGTSGDVTTSITSLPGGASITQTFSFTFGNTSGASLAWSIVNTTNVVTETSTIDNRAWVQHVVIEMATVVPPTINAASGATVVFRGVAKPYGKKWPLEQPSALITVPGSGTVIVPHNGIATLAGVGTFGPIVKNLIGDASLTCALLPEFQGGIMVSFLCGDSYSHAMLTATEEGVDRVVVNNTSPEDIGPTGIPVGEQIVLRAIRGPVGTQFGPGSPIWSIVSQPDGSNVSDPPSGSATASFTPTHEGRYVVRASNQHKADEIEVEAGQIMRTVVMTMRDPEVNKQADFGPPGGTGYPNGLAKITAQWEVSVRFAPQAGSPIEIKVKAIPVQGQDINFYRNRFRQIDGDDVWRAFPGNPVFTGNNSQGCTVLDSAIGESEQPEFVPAANPFPDPTRTDYVHRRINANGRWFTVEYQIIMVNGKPTLTVNAQQRPRGNRNCP
jgi:hypothetical protein